MADPIVPVPVPPVLDDANAALVSATVKHHVALATAAIEAKYEALLASRSAAPAKPEPTVTVSASDDVAQLKAQLKAMQDQSYAERKASRETSAFQALRTELSGKVRPEGVEHVAKLIMFADKRVHVADDGHVTFKVADADYSLAEGVAAYLRTPDVAMFIPAPGTPARNATRPVTRPLARPAPTAPVAGEDPLNKTLRDLGF